MRTVTARSRRYRRNEGHFEDIKAGLLLAGGGAVLLVVDNAVGGLPWWVWAIAITGGAAIMWNGLAASGNY